ncbi:hypothetical protein BDN67DRAFT_975798 [Paxillus ammoniavirescens]|nr:hypothetical protein BDN67DRAFT_975798 [Paxillus ammoniavirescens]
MLCVAGDFPLFTLEGDLQKHSYEITNWLFGVPHENDEGINTLSVGHLHKLYVALTQVINEGRSQLLRCVGQST